MIYRSLRKLCTLDMYSLCINTIRTSHTSRDDLWYFVSLLTSYSSCSIQLKLPFTFNYINRTPIQAYKIELTT